MKIITSLKELKDFDKIILSDCGIDIKSIKNNIKNKNEKILILFTGDHFLKSLELVKKKIENVTFKQFSWSVFSHRHYEMWHSDKIAIANSKLALQKIQKKNKLLIGFIKKIYSSNKIELALEKCLANHLKGYYEKIKIYELIKDYNTNIIPIFEKKKYIYFRKLTKENDFKNIESEFHNKVLFYKNSLNLNYFFNIFVFLIYPLISILSVRKFVIKKVKKKIGLRIYKHGIGFEDSNFPLDWIIDNKKIDKNNSIFVFEDKPETEHLKGLKKKEYNFHFCTNKIPLQTCSLKFFIKIIFFYIPIIFFIFPTICTTNRYIREEAAVAWIKFFSWKNFISIYKIDNYLSYHNYTSDHIYRNIILQEKKCLTIMYKHSNSALVYDYKNTDKYGFADFMNSYYDIEYHWSKCGIEMSKINESKSKEFLLSGPIWSSGEFINKNFLLNTNNNRNSITFFTTNFLGFFATNTLEAHEKFLFLVLDIIKNYPSMNIIFKPKHHSSLYEKYKTTNELIKNLSSFKRFKIASEDVFSTKLSLKSDVVISMSFASSGFEAMCLGKKSFYVDTVNVYKNSYYDNFKNLICHSNKEALDTLEYWMKIDQKEVYSKYKEIFKDSGIHDNTNKASEIIRNRIMSKTRN